MKAYKFILVLFLISIVFYACKEEDGTPPVITLNGAATVYVDKGTVYTDAGATAFDEQDGDITDQIVVDNPVDANTLGTYTVSYNVKDQAGNQAIEVTRTVIVMIF